MKIFKKIIIFLYLISFLTGHKISAQEKIKIGLLVPISGPDSKMGNSIIKSVRLAINKIDNSFIEIIPKDTKSDPLETLEVAKELYNEGVKIVIGPVFNKNLVYLDEMNEMIFLSLSNKIINNPKNIISAGINADSQLRTISRFQIMNDLKKTIFLIPKKNYKEEIEKGIKLSKVKANKVYYYDSDPTQITNRIEKITKYSQRKRNLADEIKRLEELNENNNEKKIQNLKKRDTIGKLGFDSIVISDFDESLKSVTTSLLYTDVSPKKVYFITLNQWFDESLLKETSSQPLYFPSINKKNFDEFTQNYYNTFSEYPNQLSFLSYDLVGLVYYLILKNDYSIDKKIFIKKSMFKGKIGIFEIKDNKINHILNLYEVNNKKFKKIF